MLDQVLNNRYKIICPLGEGGMAKVYLAYDEYLKREVAIKVLKNTNTKKKDSFQRFKKEIVAITELHSKYIVQAYDFDIASKENNEYYIVMELANGRTLKDLEKKKGPIFYQEAIPIIKQIVQALKVAHSNNIIHRDIKPQNVIVNYDGQVKLMDFGLAILSDNIEVTSTNAIVGSVQYLPPEIIEGGTATNKTDIYSLGILMYELLRGDLPFKGESSLQIAMAQVNKPMPHIRKFNSQIPQSVENIIMKMTAKKPVNRYYDILEVEEALNVCLYEDKINEPRIFLPDELIIKKTRTHNFQVSKISDYLIVIVFVLVGILILILITIFK